MAGRKPAQIPLPKSWKTHVRSAMLNVVSLAQYAAVYSRSWAADSMNGRARLMSNKGGVITFPVSYVGSNPAGYAEGREGDPEIADVYYPRLQTSWNVIGL